jgi:hypothetical protein
MLHPSDVLVLLSRCDDTGGNTRGPLRSLTAVHLSVDLFRVASYQTIVLFPTMKIAFFAACLVGLSSVSTDAYSMFSVSRSTLRQLGSSKSLPTSSCSAGSFSRSEMRMEGELYALFLFAASLCAPTQWMEDSGMVENHINVGNLGRT